MVAKAKSKKIANNGQLETIKKAPTGIQGLDEITEGGLPEGRPTLICGSAGCGKTLMAMEFLVRGASEFMRTHGVEVIDLDLSECVQMMQEFIAKHPAVWIEDIGI